MLRVIRLATCGGAPLRWVIVASFAFVLGHASLAPAQFAEWVAPVDGPWTDGSRWSSAPAFPNGSFSTALITAPGPDYAVELDAAITLRRLELTSPNATLHIPAGRGIHLGTTSFVTNGAHVHLSGGTFDIPFVGGPGNGRILNVDGGRITLDAGTLTGEAVVARAGARIIQSAGLWGPGPTWLFDSTYELRAGVCDTSNVHVAGVGSNSLFHQTGGTFGTSGPRELRVGYGTSAFGAALIEGPSSVFNGADVEIAPFSGAVGTVTFRDGAMARINAGYVGLNAGNGTLHVDSDARLELSRVLLGGGQFGSSQPGTGTIHLSGGEIVGFVSSIYRIGATTFGSSGMLRIDGGTLDAQGVVIVNGPGSGAGNGTVLMSGGFVRPALFNVFGTFDKTGGDFRADLNVTNGRVLHGGGSATVASATINNATTGTFVLSGGTFAVGSFLQSAGASAVTGGAYAAQRTSVYGGTMTYAGGAMHAGALDVQAARLDVTPGGDKVLRATSLAIGGAGGRVDLTDNAMHLDYAAASPIAGVRASIASGYSGGAWTGDGLTSSAAAANAGHALGYAEASALAGVPPVFGAVDATSVLIRYTRYGDADLSGVVNLDDFNRLAAHFGGAGAFWSDGDFNYDGFVNLEDFNLLAANFGMSAAGPAVTLDDWAALASAVPEPATAALVPLVLLRSRRRRP